jgi:hypothetical protein
MGQSMYVACLLSCSCNSIIVYLNIYHMVNCILLIYAEITFASMTRRRFEEVRSLTGGSSTSTEPPF